MDRQFKRPSDGEPSGSSKRQKVESHALGGFASGEAGRQHLRFTGTATIHFDVNINTESLSKESEQQQQEIPPEKAHDQASSRKPCREVRLFGVNIAGDQRMDEKSKEIALNFFKKAELNSYHKGYQKPLDERSVKEAIAVAMYEVIIDKCFKNNEQDLIQPFLREVRQLDLYKQAYGRKKSSLQQREGPQFEEDREKFPKQKPTSEPWSHEGEKRQSHQAWEKEKKEVIDISTDSDNESNHENEILKEKKGEIAEIIDSILNAPYKSRIYFKDIKSKIDGKLESSEDVEIAQNYLEDTWNKYSRHKKVSTSVRRDNLLKSFKAVKTINSEQ